MELAAISLTAAYLSSVGIAPVTGQCPGGGIQPRVVAMLRDDAGRMPESGTVRGGGAPAASVLTCCYAVGRDGIEPPTLRFSAARSTD